jgi:membrane-bound metal-dependent hydrolase YbcI (DUF457 family)
MPGRKAHRIVGTASGGIYAAHRARNQVGLNHLSEVLGGCVGGYVGGRAPDVLEPAISSWHRGTFHSATAGAGIVSLTQALSAWVDFCRAQAINARAVPTKAVETLTGIVYVPQPRNGIEKFFSNLLELFWSFLAGLTNGFVAGYGSHLALDAFTPRSIPILPTVKRNILKP